MFCFDLGEQFIYLMCWIHFIGFSWNNNNHELRMKLVFDLGIEKKKKTVIISHPKKKKKKYSSMAIYWDSSPMV